MPFKEYSIREESEPLRQGDIFHWNNSENEPWQKFGIIITADCDLAHRKHRNLLSYCPILASQDFLKLFWVTDDFTRLEKQYTGQIAERLTKARRQHRPEYGEPIQPDLIIGWLNRRGISGLMDDIGQPNDKIRAKLVADLELLKRMRPSLENDDLKSQLILLARVKLGNSSASEVDIANSIKKMWDSYVQKINSLPGDLFFINELSPEDRDGYIVYLRRIAEIQPDTIAITQSMLRNSNSKAVRISQLRATFRYRLTQKLASVFTDIGLPTEYENMSIKTVTDVAVNLDIPIN